MTKLDTAFVGPLIRTTDTTFSINFNSQEHKQEFLDRQVRYLNQTLNEDYLLNMLREWLLKKGKNN